MLYGSAFYTSSTVSTVPQVRPSLTGILFSGLSVRESVCVCESVRPEHLVTPYLNKSSSGDEIPERDVTYHLICLLFHH